MSVFANFKAWRIAYINVNLNLLIYGFFFPIRLARMQALIHFCHFNVRNNSQFGGEFTNDSFFHIMQDIAPSFNSTFVRCEWQNKHYPCSELFSLMLTSAGICYTFNALNSQDVYTKEWVALLDWKSISFCRSFRHQIRQK